MSHRLVQLSRTRAWLFCAILVLAAGLPQGLKAQEDGSLYVPGEIVIGWTPEESGVFGGSEIRRLDEDRSAPEWQTARQALAERSGLQVADIQPGYGTALLAVAEGQEETEIVRLRQMPWVRYAEPNYIVRATAAGVYPNDPLIGEQWHMRRVHAPEAWATTFGSSTVVVAVVDSGVDRNHPEFNHQFRDPLYPGWDYVNNDADPNDDYGHGTHVTGLIAAAENNGVGVVGLASKVKILPLKVLNSKGEGDFYNVAKAIRRAADFGAQVINLSLGGRVRSYDEQQTLQSAVDYAVASDSLVIAAVGNCAQGGVSCGYVNPTFFPAACNGVFAVAASDHFDNWASYSNYKSYVSLAAPGGVGEDAILSTLPRSIVPGGYGYLYGTSMATPLVSAAAALVWTLKPTATAPEVAQILKDTADKVGAEPYAGGRNDYFGYGRLNAADAVRLAYPPSLTPVSAVQRFLTSDPSLSVRAVTLANPSEQQVSWQAEVVQGGNWLSAGPPSGLSTYSHPSTLFLYAWPAALPPGTYPGTVRVTAVSPAWVSPVDIQVELRVAEQLNYTRLPAIVRNWYGIGWLDPFAAGAPPPNVVNLTNNTAYPVSLPFPVTFYGRTYTAIWVSDNGVVWFGSATSAAAQPPTACLPSAAAPNNAIYALALDWDPSLGGRVYAHRPDEDTFAITWYQVRRLGTAMPQSFQLVFRRTGEIAVSYRTIEALPAAIIGTENDDGTVAQQIFCNGVGHLPSDGDTVRLQAVLPW